MACANGSATVVARHGVVATDEAECSRIGRDVLRRGGHAVDGAVAAALCLGVVNPAHSGLGGGGFMLVRSSSGRAKVFDMREMAPGRASKDMFPLESFCRTAGALSIAVPGQLAGLYKAHKEYGKIQWASLVKPAETLARRGFNVSEALFQKMTKAKSIILSNNQLQSIFAPKGKLLIQGQTVRLRKLADTLAAIAKDGINSFYNGAIARSLAEDIKKAGGIITKADFDKYRVITRKPIGARAMGYDIVTAPPPAAGGAMMILILPNYGATSVPIWLEMHRFLEALKYALAQRMSLGDPAFVNVTNVLQNMISTSFAKKMKDRINDNKTFDSAHYGSKWSQVYDEGTTHVCVVDNQRNVVTMTTSLNSNFGSKFMSPSTGIFLNNQMCDFSVTSSHERPPSPANFVQPFKRPLSSMAPTILLKGKQVKAVIGAAGGILIPDAVTQVLINHFILKLDPFTAVRIPRLYHMLYPDVVFHEKFATKAGRYEYSSKVLNELKKKGHLLRECSSWTVCHFVIQKLSGPNSGQLVAVSDPRKGGAPAGY
ncbi:Glutathione hydrolase 2 [Sesamum alatum]|uniref:Glutathione hydrolase 2 n=1 Tax=Sesamum alatum TaxID=300844 RepID=A0AAE1YV68_9LAMI|nr:Glutathione hydrolase 2 [Sesamum alatum]